MKLEGKVAIVTGGARDLGRAISVKLAAEGAKVCLNYFDNEADAQETLALIKNVGVFTGIKAARGRFNANRKIQSGLTPDLTIKR